jgi:hypothetical protein
MISFSINLRSVIKLALLILLLPTYTWANAPIPAKNDNKSPWENVRVSIDLAGGRSFVEDPLLSIKKDPGSDDYYAINSKPNFHYSLSMLVGYVLGTLEKHKLGFEVGIGYGFPRSIQLPEVGISFQEDYIKIPFTITILETYKTPFYLAQSMILGYELDIILQSSYKQSGYYAGLATSIQGDKDIQKYISDFSRLSGSILLGTRFDFPKGIYLGASLTIPIEAFKLIFGHLKEESAQLNKYFVDRMRYGSAGYLTFNAGVNIIDWFFPKEVLSKSNQGVKGVGSR